MVINKKRTFFRNKLTESIGKVKDLWKALRLLGLPSKISSCEVNALKIKNIVERDVNSVLQGFTNQYSTLVKNLEKCSPNQLINTLLTLIKYYEHMILGDYFYLAFVSEISALTISKAN